MGEVAYRAIPVGIAHQHVTPTETAKAKSFRKMTSVFDDNSFTILEEAHDLRA